MRARCGSVCRASVPPSVPVRPSVSACPSVRPTCLRAYPGLVVVGADELNPTARQLLDPQQSRRLLDTNSRELALPVDVEMLVLRHLATCLKEAGALLTTDPAAPKGSAAQRRLWRYRWLKAIRRSAFGSERTKAALGRDWVNDLLKTDTVQQAVDHVNRRCVRACNACARRRRRLLLRPPLLLVS